MSKTSYTNPIIFADYSDPDVIRVGDTYYMVASSFNYTPGLPILISKDLVNWKLANYAVENIYGSIEYDLPQHSKGVWAPAIRYHEDRFYIYYGMPDDGIYMVETKDPLGKWEKPVLVLEGKGLIDPCPFWDEDGKAYVVHGYAKSRIGFKSHLGIFEMSFDGKQAISNDRIIYVGTETQPTIEGPKVYKREGMYYIFAPAGGVRTGWQTVLRSESIKGPFEEKIVMEQGNSETNGPHQGGLVCTSKGEEWFVHFQDRGAYGRIVHLQPVSWDCGWPIIGEKGENGCGNPVSSWTCPEVGNLEFSEMNALGLEATDYFKEDELNLLWQWTGNHYDSFYSLKERPGYLRLYSRENTETLFLAPNILTQKIIYPSFRMKVCMDVSHLEDGEQAGVTMYGGRYAFMSIRKNKKSYQLCFGESANSNGKHEEKEQIIDLNVSEFDPNKVYFVIDLIENEGKPETEFFCSFDGESKYEKTYSFLPVDDTWVAAKPGIFSVSKKVGTHGFADVSFVDVKEGPMRPMFRAAEKGDLQAVKHYVEYSTESMNTKDEDGRGILHYAVRSKNLELVSYLVDFVGMEIREGDRYGISPLELAYTLEAQDLVSFFSRKMGFDNVLNRDDFYKNPIRTGMFPDPSIVRVGEDYYMVNSSFVYFPCIPISHSKDLIHWQVIGYAITNPDWSGLSDLECGRGYWAPDISYHEGKFYITATYRMNDSENPCRKQIVVSSERAEGPYSEPSFIDEDGIDPSLFWSNDGKCYMLLNRGARIMELSDDASKKISDAKLLYYGDHKRAPEGPHLIEKDGYFYLFLAEGGTGELHRITVARAKDLFGPYEPCPYNPIMNQKDPAAYIQRSGHGKPVQTTDGEWWMVYLCGRYTDGRFTICGRETALDPITWTEDGWPIVNGLNGPSVIQKKPMLETHISKEGDQTNKNYYFFREWMSIREPEEKAFRKEKEWIVIRGSAYDYNHIESRNLLLKRRTNLVGEMKIKMRVPELVSEQRAGIICYYDENSWCTFAIKKEEGNFLFELKQYVGGTTEIEKYKLNEDAMLKTGDVITLGVSYQEFHYSFYFENAKKEKISIFEICRAEYLSDEGLRMGKRFTGVSTGVFAYAGEQELFVNIAAIK